ncbi:MAG TPA: adenylate/guanylate cyclase domain-containing protein, partial [Anaerolineales bacterium]|nr:adenylate/guanylate cyclase domain-containing protein [Anaerolineales bacterium]
MRRSRSMEGERRVVTILFCDVADSTRMAESLDPEDWAEIMDSAFEHMIAPVVRYEGIVARLMGDAILALFGAPTSHEDDPQRALLAALEIIEELRPFQAKVRREHRLDFNVRIGINTGAVVVGEVGSDLAGEYTAMGDAVNLASRLQSSAEPGTVHISESTYKITEPLFDFEALGATKVRGRELDVSTYRLIGQKETPGSVRGLEGLASPLVGRDHEAEVLENALDELELGRGAIVGLIGDAGLGKTRLIEELKARWEKKRAEEATPGIVAWSEARGISYDQTLPYSLFIGGMRTILGLSGEDTAESTREKIAAYLALAGADDAAIKSQALEALLGVTDYSPEVVDGEALKRQLIAVFQNHLRQSASLRPIVAVFDDLHWADPASAEVLKNLLQLTDTVPILLVCSMRPDRRSPGWQVRIAAESDFPHRYREIQLKPLTPNDSAALVNNLLTISELPAQIQTLISRKAEGNPFFIEEVIRTLIENGVIAREKRSGRWAANKQVGEVEIPDNLQSLIISRIDRLEPEDRRTLQLASVIGRNFSMRVLEQMDSFTKDLPARLNTLERMGLVTEHSRTPELEYRFVHELTRDAAYHSILRRQRREYHILAGEAIEKLYPEGLEENAHRLAYHFEQGRSVERALEYYRMAAEAAARVHANAEAADHYEHAISLAEGLDLDLAELAAIVLRRGRILEEIS